ncbi:MULTISPECIES: exodeoxyribonuclease III [Aliarcobacter]|uniref:Exodeoxyribonuclease III n=1 Tax=Aliarcobacter cibarius TaxID=255507 RepID=A0ABY2V4Z4_9BACT|nr:MULTISPECIES: exodeoxyribonuclease III [Aliarcobacter]MDK2047857.1 exodeoxyribonuclease III [Aliarcobacter butzleri]TLS96825.1 exodeoxyribonuclease III [Aliarcobacter cibarius]TLS97330.1 exodeoxyribonuclease III [Aliarcobacter cibarius]
MKIFSWNVNGIRAIAKKNVFDWIGEHNPDLLLFQEIKASIKQIPDFFDENYKEIIVNSGKKDNQSGVASFTNLKLDSHYFCNEIDRKEGRIIEMKYNDIFIFNVYVPNGKASKERLNYKLEFYDKFLKYCETLLNNGNSVIICGDLNTAHKDIDLKKTKIHSKDGFSEKERKYLNKFFEIGFVDSYRYICGDNKEAYTWWSYRSKGKEKNEGWRIDYILVSDDLKEKIINVYILNEVSGSDHCPIGLELYLV